MLRKNSVRAIPVAVVHSGCAAVRRHGLGLGLRIIFELSYARFIPMNFLVVVLGLRVFLSYCLRFICLVFLRSSVCVAFFVARACPVHPSSFKSTFYYNPSRPRNSPRRFSRRVSPYTVLIEQSLVRDSEIAPCLGAAEHVRMGRAKTVGEGGACNCWKANQGQRNADRSIGGRVSLNDGTARRLVRMLGVSRAAVETGQLQIRHSVLDCQGAFGCDSSSVNLQIMNKWDCNLHALHKITTSPNPRTGTPSIYQKAEVE